MSRARRLIALLAVAAAISATAVLATSALHNVGKAARRASSPSCLPATLEHSAKLEGLPVDVSPAPQTDTASPYTQISFMGVPPAEIHRVSVVGQRSGQHHGNLRAYSQGDGASFVPDVPFQAGERVVVRAAIGPGAGRAASFRFRVDTPYPTATVPGFPNPHAASADYQSFLTLPGVQAPILSVTATDRDPAAGDILTTNGPGPGQYGPLIYTPQGRLVWFHQLSGGLSAENLSVQSYAGRRALTFWQGRVLSLGFGQGEDVVMNSNYQTVARIPGANGLQADLHDFQIAPHDVTYITAYNPIYCDLSSVEGARDGAVVDTAVQELDMKTGLVRWEWHSLDHVGVAESETAAPTRATPWDWFHLNSVDPEPNGNIFISARSTWAGYQLEGGTGDILWRLGGTRSSFKMGPGTRTAWQHDGRVLRNGDVTFFDNGSNPQVHRQSRAVRIALDFKTHEALLRSVYTHPNRLLAASQGNMQTLANGNAVVNYGGVPQISEYAAGGSLLFDAHLPLEMDTYRAFRFPWSGQPLAPPTVLANLNNTGEETMVHMSWNGASEVASWRVLAGGAPRTLQAQSTIPTGDFESSTILPKKYDYVAVQALDSAGRILDTSPPSKVATYDASFPAPR
jgi:Arylsulfotransferase (ASST)